jgi:low affinity Fe/Cu permease
MFEKGQVGRIRTEFMRKDDVIAVLQAENERLRKAGDALAKAAEQSAYHKEDYNVIKAWLAAKGVQS